MELTRAIASHPRRRHSEFSHSLRP